MEVLQWVLLSGISATLISIIFFLFLCVSFVIQRNNIKKLPQRQSRSKRKRRKAARERQALVKKSRRTLGKAIAFLVLSLVFAGGSFYVTYYQATNLTAEDTSNLIDGYYYLKELEDELIGLEDSQEDKEKAKQTLSYVATSLAGYGAKSASTLNTVEGQTVLNRYYLAMSEVGLNVSRQRDELVTNEDLVTEVLADLEKVLTHQEQAFKYFKVNEAALEAQR